MKTIKARLIILVAALLATSLTACNGGNAALQTETPAGPTTSPSQTETPASPATSPSADGLGDNTPAEDGEPAWWDGFDFGPNLGYAEVYINQSDSGEYLNTAEAAKLTFYAMKDNDHIPEYIDDLEYIMTLIDITDIEGEECYVYRLNVDEPSATIGIAYAYAYQSGNIYMEGDGGQWVQPEILK